MNIDYSKILPVVHTKEEIRTVYTIMSTIIEIFEIDSITRKVNYYSQFNNFYLRGEGNELMLRFNQYTKQLVVARVQFNNRGSGFFTRVLELLEDIPNYDIIVIESVLTEEMKRYVQSKGFKEDKYLPFNYNRSIKKTVKGGK